MTQYNGKANALAFRRILGGKMPEELLKQREEQIVQDISWDHEGVGKHADFWVVWGRKP